MLNDSFDKRIDKDHPVKKFRPIASGSISINSAILFSIILLILSLIIGLQLNIFIFIVLVLYFAIQFLYCLYLKHVPLIELFCVASGFVLRSISGALASDIYISYWFLLSIGMLALFIAIEKRKAEIISSQDNNFQKRAVLNNYSISLINKFESVLSSCIVMTYSLWSYGPVLGGAKSPWMMLTIPLVILGIFRYQMLGEVNKNKLILLETPEDILFNDKSMQLILVSWLLITIFINLLSS